MGKTVAESGMSAAKAVAMARTKLIMKHPFFGILACHLEVVESTIESTAWTDGSRLGYHPDFINALEFEQVVGLIAHEVSHNAFLHHARRKNRDHLVWNIAGDFVINKILTDSNFLLPDGALLDARYDAMNTDEVYADLMRHAKIVHVPMGIVMDGQGDVSQVEGEWKIKVAAAAQSAKMAGNMPADLDRLIKEMLEPKIDWQSQLRRFMHEVLSRTDYTWMRPSRRYIAQDLYLPSLSLGESLRSVVIVLDTSGSMSEEDLAHCATEIRAIVEQYSCKTYILYADTKVANIQVVEEGEPLPTLKAKGGGGTSYVDAITKVNDNDWYPSCLLYFTDLWCSDYPPKPPYPVLWITENHESQPQFGETLYYK